MKKANSQNKQVKLLIDQVLDKYVNLESNSPELPLKNVGWGVIWFDEFYNENQFGDFTFVMSPKDIITLVDESLRFTRKTFAYVTDCGNTYEVETGSLGDANLIELHNALHKPFYILDDSLAWFIECHFEGSNFFAKRELMASVIVLFGGAELIYSRMLSSLDEYKAVRDVRLCEYDYLQNVFHKLQEIEGKVEN